MSAFRIAYAGDSVVILELEERIDPEVNARAVAVATSLERSKISGVRDVVPTFRSVAVHFDPLRTDVREVIRTLEVEAARPVQDAAADRPPIRIPVCYGGTYGPDLGDVATYAGLGPSEVTALHASRTYRVFMLGFLPGFAYMASVDPRIAAPRLATPRVRVPSGSVGIAGVQTAIYPSESPGGWRLVGRTPVKPFDVDRQAPFLFKAGDRVEFYPIDPAEYAGFRVED